MIKLIRALLVIVTFILLCECIYKSKTNSKLRMRISTYNKTIGLKCYLFMKKYKWIYRIICELAVIWFVFEWNNKFIINTITKWSGKAYNVISPFFQQIVTFLVWISPYGRPMIENETVSYWMKCFSIGILIVYVLNGISILMGVKQKVSKFIVSTIGIFISWYIMLFLTKVVILIPQNYLVGQWSLAVIGFFLVIIAFYGIVYGLIYD